MSTSPPHDAGRAGPPAADAVASPAGSVMDEDIAVGRGRKLRLRPIRTDDAEALVDMGLLSTPEDLRLRFFSPVRPQIGPLTTLLTQFDRARHIAAAAYDPTADGGDKAILGVVRLVLDEDKPEGEFAIMVRSDQAGRGLGHSLMRRMLSWARDRGLARVRAEIMRENKRMLRLARSFGAVSQPHSGDFRTVRVAIDL
jgi:acetyltransferase